MKKRNQVITGNEVVRKKIGDKPLTTNQKKRRERKLKREFGLVDKQVWLLAEDVEKVEKLHEKAIKKYKKA